MQWIGEIWRRLAFFFRRGQFQRELKEEMDDHVRMKAKDLHEEGMPTDEASNAARQEFGNALLLRDRSRDTWGFGWLEALVQDLRYGLRQLRHNPGFTAVAIITLALGIGATTAIYTLINTVLLKPLPYPHAGRLVQFEVSLPRVHFQSYRISIAMFMAVSRNVDALEDFAMSDFSGPGVNLTGGPFPEQVSGIHVSASYFRLFGAPMALGRPFTAREDVPGGSHLAVISYGLWKTRFGGDPNIVGRTVQLDGLPYVVTGVAGRNFQPELPAEVWLPLQADPNTTNGGDEYYGAALLKPGATLAEANAQLRNVANAFHRRFPGRNANWTAVPMLQVETGGIRSALLVLFGAVMLVLLIASVNLANLLLARATLRKREIAIRTAVGAGRGRVIRQLLTETLLLSLFGGATGLICGFVGLHALLAINVGNIPRIGPNGAAVSLDWRVVAFAVALSAFTGVLFGLIPAFHSSRTDLAATLKEGGSRSGSGFDGGKFRSTLVIAETALALVLLTGAGLLIRTLVAMRAIDPGFDPHHVLTMEMSLMGPHFQKTAAIAAMVRQAEQKMKNLPGVVGVSESSSLPLELLHGTIITVPGHPEIGKYPFQNWAEFVLVSPEFFRVFRIPLLHGRFFTEADNASSRPVVIINQMLVRQYWRSGDPVGGQLSVSKMPPAQIVGVVGDIPDYGLASSPPPTMYLPEYQAKDAWTAILNRMEPIFWAIRAKVPPFSLRKEIGQQLRVTSNGLPVAHSQSMEAVLAKTTAQTDFNMAVLTIFAGIALVLASVGIYGVVAYAVEQRSHEIGIRMALGAHKSAVLRLVVGQGARLALIGVGIGIIGALGLARVASSLLYAGSYVGSARAGFAVKASDPLTFAAVSLLLMGVALFACYIPARRAAKVDPMVALRHE
jgi:putative ABC transport system permease protein